MALSLVLGCAAAFALYVVVLNVEAGYLLGFFKAGIGAYASKRFVALAVACSAISYPLLFHFKGFIDFVFRYRWLIAVAFFVFCVFAQVSGSSFGLMAHYYGAADDGSLAGVARPIRSDEWAVYTPMSLSQIFSDTPFSYVDDNFRGTATDMFIVYGQPVWDIAAIFRPFHWGYLLLGQIDPDFGLSFFWCGRLIFLFMVSLEFGMRILTPNSRALAVAYALLVTSSGNVQWWFAVNGLVEMLLFGQLALVWGQAYLQSVSYGTRALCAIGIAWCLGIYILTFYPAWQVSFAYVFLALLVYLLVTQLPKAKKGLLDIGIVVIALVLLAAAMAYIFTKSWDTVQAVSSTAYPGKRTELGGGGAMWFLYYPVQLATPMISINMMCEYGTFFNAFPLCLLLPFYVMIRRRKASSMLVCLLAATLLLAAFSIWKLPEPVAKLTLLSHSLGPRAADAAVFAMLMLLFVSLNMLKAKDRAPLFVLIIISAAVEVFAICNFGMEFPKVYYAYMIAVTLAFFVAIWFVTFKWGKREFCAACFAIAALTGMFVNPLSFNVASAYQQRPETQAIVEASLPDDVWATEDMNFPYANGLAALGLHTLTTTNTYPQLDTWRILDDDGSDDNVYNRYAHVNIDLKESGQPEFKLTSVDAFTLSCTVDDLGELGVTKVLSGNPDLANIDSDKSKLELVEKINDGLFIYQLEDK